MIFTYKLNLTTQLFARRLSKLSYIHKVGPQPLLALTGGQLIAQAAGKYANRPAIISCHQRQRLTFTELAASVDRFAAGLAKRLDVRKGDALAIWAPNCIEWVVTSLACARLGAVLVQLNHSYKKNELLYSVNKTKAKALVCGHVSDRQPYYDIIKEVDGDIFRNGPKLRSKTMPSLKSVIMMDEKPEIGTYQFNELSQNHSTEDLEWVAEFQSKVHMDDPVNIQLTSGSTGNPKAAVLSHHNMVNNSFLVGNRLQFAEKHHKLCVQVPLFHTFGTTAGIFVGLHFGATLVLPTDFYSPRKALEAIRDHGCTVIYGTPTMHHDLIEQQKQHQFDIAPEIACSGGAPTTPKLVHDLYTHLKCKSVVNFFGMTETTAVCFQSYLNANSEHVANSVGHIGEHCEVKVIDEQGHTVPFGTPGEFCARGYMNMLGYLDDEENTAEMIGPDRWLRTGDKIILYEDGTGKVLGRLKDIIIRGGENIHPKEVEDFLSKHPKVLDCQIVGLPHDRLGEEVCACVILKPGEAITLPEVVDFCKEHMAHYKIPSKLHTLEAFPKTTSGKIQKFKIIEALKTQYGL